MKTNHILILGIVFAMLFGVSIIQKAVEKQAPASEHRREVWRPLIPTERVARIVFSKPKQPPLSVSREKDQWKVDSLSGAAADALKINQILQQLNNIQAEWRAEGEEFFQRFGVAEDQAFRLQILNSENNAMLDFYIGVQRAGTGIFIRLPTSSKIYFVSDDLPALFGLYAADLETAAPLPIFFADLRLVPETFEQIQRFEITSFQNGAKTTLAVLDRPSTQAGTPWKFVSDAGIFSPGFEKIENYLAKLVGAHGENIVPAQSGWKPKFEIMIRDERGKVLRLEFSKNQDTVGLGKAERWFAKREGDPQIFEVSALVVNDLLVEDASFIESNPLHIEINQGYSVELQDEIRTETFSHASGWPSAAAILDAASRLRFLRKEMGITSQDLQGFPPTHRLKIMNLGVTVAELNFYAADANLKEIKTVFSGQEAVYVVSRDFFETIFIPKELPSTGGVSAEVVSGAVENNVSGQMESSI